MSPVAEAVWSRIWLFRWWRGGRWEKWAFPATKSVSWLPGAHQFSDGALVEVGYPQEEALDRLFWYAVGIAAGVVLICAIVGIIMANMITKEMADPVSGSVVMDPLHVKVVPPPPPPAGQNGVVTNIRFMPTAPLPGCVSGTLQYHAGHLYLCNEEVWFVVLLRGVD